ncbi:uncharacterized protein LOC131692199 [Topomyia yanbarensis]|uniref:uncharacterized protein LOC131692199 n=1 Tax=Topomyia yanbarensis TaxID=2498891 RepID=UPI00273C0288|nr:uncharacterized protein LOC131692199 [Topomyia yanbarensis]
MEQERRKLELYLLLSQSAYALILALLKAAQNGSPQIQSAIKQKMVPLFEALRLFLKGRSVWHEHRMTPTPRRKLEPSRSIRDMSAAFSRSKIGRGAHSSPYSYTAIPAGGTPMRPHTRAHIEKQITSQRPNLLQVPRNAEFIQSTHRGQTPLSSGLMQTPHRQGLPQMPRILIQQAPPSSGLMETPRRQNLPQVPRILIQQSPEISPLAYRKQARQSPERCYGKIQPRRLVEAFDSPQNQRTLDDSFQETQTPTPFYPPDSSDPHNRILDPDESIVMQPNSPGLLNSTFLSEYSPTPEDSLQASQTPTQYYRTHPSLPTPEQSIPISSQTTGDSIQVPQTPVSQSSDLQNSPVEPPSPYDPDESILMQPNTTGLLNSTFQSQHSQTPDDSSQTPMRFYGTRSPSHSLDKSFLQSSQLSSQRFPVLHKLLGVFSETDDKALYSQRTVPILDDPNYRTRLLREIDEMIGLTSDNMYSWGNDTLDSRLGRIEVDVGHLLEQFTRLEKRPDAEPKTGDNGELKSGNDGDPKSVGDDEPTSVEDGAQMSVDVEETTKEQEPVEEKEENDPNSTSDKITA